MFIYLALIFKIRDKMIDEYEEYGSIFKKFKIILEFKNKLYTNPLLFSAKRN